MHPMIEKKINLDKRTCAFCAAEPKEASVGDGWTIVYCDADYCPVGPVAGRPTKESAWKAWNTRDAEIDLWDEIETLRDKLNAAERLLDDTIGHL